MKTVLLTGATGFLGGHLARHLATAGYRLVALSRQPRVTPLLEPVWDGIDWYAPEALSQAFEEQSIDAVIHAAGIYGRQGELPAELVDVNVRFGLQLFDQANRSGVRCFINTGSSLPRETGAYALSKAQLGEWLELMAGKGDMRVLHLRLEHMYGPFDDATKFVTRSIRQLLAGVPEMPLTEGSQQRDFVYIDDVVAAYTTLLGADTGSGYAAFDVGSGQAVSIRSLMESLKGLCESGTRLDFGAVPLRPGEPACLQAVTAPLEALGWRCRMPLEDGLRETIAWEKTWRHT